MARPPKRGLAYFPMDVDFFQDPKIATLLEMHGPLGVITYISLLTLIYREGYYIHLAVSDAALYVVRTVGSSWYRKNGMSAIDLASKIILNCAEIGLLDESLVRQKVMTSVGIQRRYANATARNKVKIDEYRLLDNNGNSIALESAPMPRVSASETRVFATETPVFAAEMPQSKEKKIKENIYSRQGEVSATETGQDDDLSTEKSTGFSTGTSPLSKADAIQTANAVGELFKQTLPSLPYTGVTERLIVEIGKAAKPVDYYREVFERAAKSSWLCAPRPGASWCCSLEWLCKPANAEKVLAGDYDDFAKPGKPQVAPERQGVTIVNGVESGFDTESMFEAALRRSWQTAQQDPEILERMLKGE